MSHLQKLIDEAHKDKSLMEKVYGSFPVSIANKCGENEVKEIIERLDHLSKDKKDIEEWDGDSMDDIWRVQSGLSELLENILPNYALEIAEGLKSNESETGFYISYALSKSPSEKAIKALSEYLLGEMPNHHRETGISALKVCKKKRSFFSKLFNRNA